MIVPNCPSGVVFHREDFLHDAFEVDNFLAKYAEGNFEMLRDELGMYLQVLRVAMIELVKLAINLRSIIPRKVASFVLIVSKCQLIFGHVLGQFLNHYMV